MPKYPKWKVSVSAQSFFSVEVDAETQEQAVKKAVREVQENPEYHNTGNATVVTGVFINDREARDFYLYVPESLPAETTNLIPKSNESV